MTPFDKTKFKTTAQMRDAVNFFVNEQEEEQTEREALLESSHYVDGYAALYNRYPLFEIDGETVYEENGLRLALRSEEMGGACVQEDSKQCWFLTVENDTDRGIRLAAAEQSVNGAAVPYGFSFEHAALGPGQRTVLRIELSYYGSQPPATRESPAERIGFVLKVMNFTNTAELWRSDAPLELVFQ